MVPVERKGRVGRLRTGYGRSRESSERLRLDRLDGLGGGILRNIVIALRDDLNVIGRFRLESGNRNVCAVELAVVGRIGLFGRLTIKNFVIDGAFDLAPRNVDLAHFACNRRDFRLR